MLDQRNDGHFKEGENKNCHCLMFGPGLAHRRVYRVDRVDWTRSSAAEHPTQGQLHNQHRIVQRICQSTNII